MPSEHLERLALESLLAHLRESRLEEWAISSRPERTVRKAPACDYLLTEATSARWAALEVTTFDWPTNRTSLTWRLRALAKKLEGDLHASLRGIFSLGVDLNSHRSKPENRRRLRGWLIENAEGIPVGKLFDVPGVSGVNVMKLVGDGPLEIWFNQSSVSIEYPDWINDLESVMNDNARKFDGIGEALKWLLVIYPGISGKFEITGPALSVPPQIDELFFVDHWPPQSTDIVEYAAVKIPMHEFDRTTGATRIRVPASPRNRP